MSKNKYKMTSKGPNMNYINGEYVGAFTMEKPFGPHVRKCVCDLCHKAFLAETKRWQAKHDAADAALTPEERENRKKLADQILNEIMSEERVEKPEVPNPAQVQVGSRVVICGRYASSKGRIGTVVEMPGPSKKYGGRKAERIEVLLDANADYEWETMWTNNNQYGWLELA